MEAATLTLVGRCVLRTVGLLPRRMEAVGAFGAVGDISLRPGTFDAVGDGNPVPERAGCPHREGSAPLRAQCPRP